MAMPDDSLSSIPIEGKYLPPDDREANPTVSYSLGGVALNDPTQGLRYQVWTCDYVGGKIRINAPNQKQATNLFAATDITEVSLAFDQNMRPFVAYTQAEIAKYYWYDTLLAQAVHTELPSGSICPCATLDDKRDTQLLTSDVILAYIRDKKLYMRKQRDRYGIEYLLADAIDAKLIKIGMTDKNRLQFKLRSDV